MPEPPANPSPPPPPPPLPLPPPRRPSERGEVDDLGNEAGWDPASVSAAKPHYPYAAILRLDFQLRLASFFSLAPVFWLALLAGVAAYDQKMECGSLLCIGSLMVPFLARLERPTLARVIAGIAYGLFFMLSLIALEESLQHPDTTMRWAAGGLFASGVIGPACWFATIWLQRRVLDLHLPDDLTGQIGSLLQPNAARAWVALQREADLAEQSIGWGAESPRPQGPDAPGPNPPRRV